MQYAILIYENADDFAKRSDARGPAYLGEWGAYTAALGEAGRLVGGAALSEPHTGRVVRVTDAGRSVQDGPFADTKEQLGGFFIIDADDLDAALAWAARCPNAPTGVVEVRPLLALPTEAGDAAAAEPPAATHAILIYGDEEAFEAAPEEERRKVFAAYGEYSAALGAAGKLHGGDPLEHPRTATTVRLRGGERLVQDGPYPDSKEQLGGYYLIAADTDAEALEWAARCPGARFGAVEVRAAPDLTAGAGGSAGRAAT